MPPPPAHATSAARVAGGAVVVIAVDQATKHTAPALAAAGWDPWIEPSTNPEFSLGLAAAPYPLTLALCAAGIIAFALVARRSARRRAVPVWSIAAVLGGATSNLLDRLLAGAVHDFLATPWIVFNLADVAVVIGLVGFLRPRHLPGQ